MSARMPTLHQRFSVSEAERQFRKACNKVALLNQKVREVKRRHSVARISNNRVFRTSLKMKLAVVEGARDLYLEYAISKAEEVAKLRREMEVVVPEVVVPEPQPQRSE